MYNRYMYMYVLIMNIIMYTVQCMYMYMYICKKPLTQSLYKYAGFVLVN